VIGGWMAAFYSLAQFAFAPLMGNLSDPFGRRPTTRELRLAINRLQILEPGEASAS